MGQENNKMKVLDFELSVLINGKPINEYGKEGKTYVEGRKGQEFSLRFKNNHPNKVLAIPTIDGISIIDGEPATKDSRGYIVDAYSSAEFKGWRTSLLESAMFKFAKKSKSFSNEQGLGTANCGVIGCLVVEEKKKPEVVTRTYIYNHPWWDYYWYRPWYYPKVTYDTYQGSLEKLEQLGSEKVMNNVYYSSGTTQPDGLTFSSCTTNMKIDNVDSKKLMKLMSYKPSKEVPDFDLGTDHGRKIDDVVREESFEKGNTLALLEIYYASRRSLEEIGIDLSKDEKLEARMPRSFADNGFCKIN